MVSVRKELGLERNLVVLLGALFLLGLGEELWGAFVPKYLEALGAGVWAWSAYQALKDLLDAVYQYPGGLLADRLGRRRALVLFNLLALCGYVLFLVGTNAAFILGGTLLVAAWSSMSLPATFAVIGDSLAHGRRSIGFSVQSIIKRLPIVIAPIIGGVLLQHFGVVSGFRAAMAITIGLAIVAIVFQQLLYHDPEGEPPAPGGGLMRTFNAMDPGLKRLLVSDILARLCEGMPEALVIIYATTNLGAGLALFGALRGLQMLVSILLYIPAGKAADVVRRAPFIGLTFLFFALYPLAFLVVPRAGSHVEAWLAVAFVIGGLREIGEPARKSLIVDLCDPARRGEVVGVYYLVRGLSVAAAPLVGGWLWTIEPRLAFGVASALGMAAFAWYVAKGPRGHAP